MGTDKDCMIEIQAQKIVGQLKFVSHRKEIEIMKVADIHCHILPGVDDGSRDMEQTMRMIKTAYEEDIRLIIATPHYHIGKVKVNSSVAMKYLEQVKTNIKINILI